MKNLKKLKRHHLKLMMGGGVQEPTGEIDAGTDDGTGGGIPGDQRKLMKCCYPAGCSGCVMGSYLSSYCLNDGLLLVC
ncbi:hypothetical protein [Chryseobacterium indologenes]|uniref:hypothetical protein n=1 Tax=Chryseobacterium indologenes TaxID=253 RepID=UPI000AE70A83|nr:hypothetical protein [Chryseobacterium indologenes]